MTDPQGDLWAASDSTGNVLATISFDEFGNPQQTASLSQGQARYGWLGQYQRETDTTSGMILMGVRGYDPALGRFVSVDPVLGGSANAYDYAWQNPVNISDISGQRSYVVFHCYGVTIYLSEWATQRLEAGLAAGSGAA